MIDLSQFYQVFFDETAEHLANMEGLLLALDVQAPSLEELNAVFRAAHSIKGGSGTFGFSDMTEVTHVLETLLDRLRQEELPLTAEMVDAFLAAGDVLSAQLRHHRGGEAADAGQVSAVCERLAQFSRAQPDQSPAVRSMRLECTLAPEVAADAEGIDNLLAAFGELAACEVSLRPDAESPRLSLVLTTAHSEQELRDVLAFYVSPEDILIAEEGQTNRDEETWGLFEQGPDTGVDESWGLFEAIPEALQVDEGDGYGLFHDAPGLPSGLGIFAGAPGSEALAVGVGPSKAAVPDTNAPDRTPPAHGRRRSDSPAVLTARAGRRESDKVATVANAEASSIRVSVEKVDQLINLVGELVITQAMLAQSAQDLDPAQAERLIAGVELLSRNTRGLQEAVMSIRMLPVSMVFSRFPRVVRDLAGKLGKQVELRTVGENTELDKGLIEKIADPLTHLVRNSLDHGVETPERRIAAGKEPKGSITLKASHQGGNIVIEVIDDGAGLNRERILAKARERDLPMHDAMSDHEVWQLIFAPGFSTAEVVTDVSGRGVGMDVVKRNIEGLGGKVELHSAPGLGTRTVISLPLTLAILDGMSVGVGGETYIVPLTLVVESLQPRPEDIHTVAGQGRVVAIRGEYLPLVPLGELFRLEDAVRDPAKGILMVIEAEGGRAALFVDELLGQQQVVIKSLESNYRKIEGISGATILGDGRVALILDIAAVTRMGLQINRRSAGRQAA